MLGKIASACIIQKRQFEHSHTLRKRARNRERDRAKERKKERKRETKNVLT